MNMHNLTLFAALTASLIGCTKNSGGIEDFTCESTLTISMPNGDTSELNACEFFSFDASYEFDPDDVPEVRTLNIELSATDELGFECGATLQLQGVCGPGYYMLNSSSGALMLSSFDCEGVNDAYEGEFAAISGYVLLEEMDTGDEKGNFSNQPLLTTVSGSLVADLGEGLSLSGSFALRGSVVATDAEEMACSVVEGDADGDGLLSPAVGGSDCYDDDATQGVCGSVYFDGDQAYAEHPDGAAFCTGELTVEAWVKPYSFDESGSWSNVVATDDWGGGGQRGWVLNVGAAQPAFKIGTDAGWESTAADVEIEEGLWTHIAATYDETQLRVFVDGALAGTQQVEAPLNPSNLSLIVGNTPMSLGGSNKRPYHGLIDQMRISTAVRYSEDFEPEWYFVPDGYTLALWAFNEEEGGVAYDLSDGGNDLNLHDTDWNNESVEGGQ